MKFWKYGRIALASMGLIVLGLSITCCGVYTSGYMYVTGAQYSNIAAYKIDHDFGYLTPVTGSPFASKGNDPVQEAIIPGGRFLAVLNKGSNSISIYTIGGAGVLYWQANYSTSGNSPVSMAISPDGNYLYAVDQVAPPFIQNGVDINAGRGDITVFKVDPSTGKLTLVTNANTFNTTGTQLPYFTVNFNPVQIVTGSAGSSAGGGAGTFVYVLDTAYPSGASSGVPTACVNAPAGSPCTIPDVFPYLINSTTGQLTLTQNQPLQIGTLPGAASRIYSSGPYVWITDTANGNGPGRILPYTIGGGGVLQTLVGGPVNNPTTSSNPDAMIASSNNKFLYVANFGPSSPTQPNSNISAFTIDPTNGQLAPQNPVTSPSGAGPVWIGLDSTNQYLYTVNFSDNTITGKVIQQTSGQLSPLNKGNTAQPTVGQPTYMIISGRTY
jgi:6-phosphogluconolactonase (cycloisomerase 2 family)